MLIRICKLVVTNIMLLHAVPLMAAPLNITGAWIKNLPPVVPVRAGYMTIANTSNQSVSIVGIESEVFTSIDIHETVENNGMMSMQPLLRLTIAAGTSHKLKPGGIHLMMMQPSQILKPGDMVDIILVFDNGNTQTLEMTVRK
ncbi:MAG: copper chaperone PCu(A)C [Gammaproteobacteria bacterium]|nr:copper chaperone PCu(A)C [Gammaproteobacteria bacterium]